MELENKTLRDYLQSISVLSGVQAGEYDSLDDKYRFELSELRINASAVSPCVPVIIKNFDLFSVECKHR